MGLVNRLVDSKEEVLAAAEKLALELCNVPQDCMRKDRLNAYENMFGNLTQNLMNEFNRGMLVIKSGEAAAGARQFAREGKGRHGQTFARSKL